jgi:hypothetical protein
MLNLSGMGSMMGRHPGPFDDKRVGGSFLSVLQLV